MLKNLFTTGWYWLKACFMVNLSRASEKLVLTGFSTRKDACLVFTLLVMAAACFVFAIGLGDELQTTYGSLLFVLLPVAVLDQLGTLYCKQRLQSLYKAVPFDEYLHSQNACICPVSREG